MEEYKKSDELLKTAVATVVDKDAGFDAVTDIAAKIADGSVVLTPNFLRDALAHPDQKVFSFLFKANRNLLMQNCTAQDGQEIPLMEYLLRFGDKDQILEVVNDGGVKELLKAQKFNGGKNILHLAFDAFKDAFTAGDSGAIEMEFAERKSSMEKLTAVFPVVFANFSELASEKNDAGMNILEYSIRERPKTVSYLAGKQAQEAKIFAEAFTSFYGSLIESRKALVAESDLKMAWQSEDEDKESLLLSTFQFLSLGGDFCDYQVGQSKKNIMAKCISDKHLDDVSDSLKNPEVYKAVIRKGYPNVVASIIRSSGSHLQERLYALQGEVLKTMASESGLDDDFKTLVASFCTKSFYESNGLDKKYSTQFIRSLRGKFMAIINNASISNQDKQAFVQNFLVIPVKPSFLDFAEELFKENLQDHDLQSSLKLKNIVGVFPGFVGQARELNFNVEEFLRIKKLESEGKALRQKDQVKIDKINILYPKMAADYEAFGVAVAELNATSASEIAGRYPKFVTDKVLADAMKEEVLYEALIPFREAVDKPLAASRLPKVDDFPGKVIAGARFKKFSSDVEMEYAAKK